MGLQIVAAPMASSVVEVLVDAGASVQGGQPLVIVEAMKMEHELHAPTAARVARVLAHSGQAVEAGDPLLELVPLEMADSPGCSRVTHAATSAAALRADLRELQERLAHTEDESRPDAVARRHAGGLRTARENIADLCDPGSFIEYGALAIAAQRAGAR